MHESYYLENCLILYDYKIRNYNMNPPGKNFVPFASDINHFFSVLKSVFLLTLSRTFIEFYSNLLLWLFFFHIHPANKMSPSCKSDLHIGHMAINFKLYLMPNSNWVEKDSWPMQSHPFIKVCSLSS